MFTTRLWLGVTTIFVYQQLTVVPAKETSPDVDGGYWGQWSDWSKCTAECGAGITTRTRECMATSDVYMPNDKNRNEFNKDKLTGCNGKDRQTKLCNTDVCPHGKLDTRGEQCARYNSRVYSGRRYQWQAYINVMNRCELTCKAQGYSFYTRLSRAVRDGTPCDTARTSVCVGGKCLKAGCDGILESETSVDRCGVCGGDGSSCRLMSGVFPRSDLPQGYNDITRIPRGSRSINITEISASFNYLALKTRDGVYILNGPNRVDLSGQYSGVNTTFTYSRRTQRCPGSCINAKGPVSEPIIVQVQVHRGNPGIEYSYVTTEQVSHPFINQVVAAEKPKHTSFEYQPNTRKHPIASASLVFDDRGENKQQNDNDPGESLIGQNVKDETERKDQSLASTERAVNHRDAEHVDHISPGGNTQDKSARTNSEGFYIYPQYGSDVSQVSRKEVGSFTSPEVIKSRNHRHIIDARKDEKNGVNGDTPSRVSQINAFNSRGGGYGALETHTMEHAIPLLKTGDHNETSSLRSPEQVIENEQSKTESRESPASGSVLYVPDKAGISIRQPYMWKTRGFTNCSKMCGRGFQESIVACVFTDTQTVVGDENCNGIDKPSSQVVSCNKFPCLPEWGRGDWSDCNVVCGKGKRTRTIRCHQKGAHNTNATLSIETCAHLPRPPTEQSCTEKPCYSWSVGNWSMCSTQCGKGTRRRDIRCVDMAGTTVSSVHCGLRTARSEETCDVGTCSVGWFAEDWPEKCSATCGDAVMERRVLCLSEKGEQLEDGRCSSIRKRPPAARRCVSGKPCRGMWFTSSLSPCNVTCGEGYQTREVICMRRYAQSIYSPVGDRYCSYEERPSTIIPCTLPPCRPKWFTTEWSDCSVTCGTGARSRETKCLDDHLRPSLSCDSHTKPPTEETCNRRTCYTRTTTEDSSCTDQFSRCRLVVRGGLCKYNYYNKMCCRSCGRG